MGKAISIVTVLFLGQTAVAQVTAPATNTDSATTPGVTQTMPDIDYMHRVLQPTQPRTPVPQTPREGGTDMQNNQSDSQRNLEPGRNLNLERNPGDQDLNQNRNTNETDTNRK